MATVNVTVKSVKCYKDEKVSNVTLGLDKKVDGFDHDKETDVYSRTMKDSITINAAALTAQLCSLNDDVAFLRSMLARGFDQSQFGSILFKANLDLDITFFAKDDPLPDDGGAAEHDTVFYNITKVVLSQRSKDAIERLTDLAMEKSLE